MLLESFKMMIRASLYETACNVSNSLMADSDDEGVNMALRKTINNKVAEIIDDLFPGPPLSKCERVLKTKNDSTHNWELSLWQTHPRGN